jgi:hypothetical protein
VTDADAGNIGEQIFQEPAPAGGVSVRLVTQLGI